MRNEPILLVDDEPKVLSSLSRILLEEDFGEIITANNAYEALDILPQKLDTAVIISDYHMPRLNGIDFLVQARVIVPDSARILLTGAADLEMAIEAVNRGNLFRFLIKPCSPNILVGSIKDGIRQKQLITGERELLSKTLNGSIKVMIDILAVQNSYIFAQASRLRKLGHELAVALQIEEQSWEIELAALLCRIGAVTIPRETLDRWQLGITLEESELEMIHSIPRMGRQLIQNIPRMEKIAEAVGLQNCTYRGQKRAEDPSGEAIPLLARILKILVDYDEIQGNTYSSTVAYQTMLRRSSEYDPNLLSVFRAKVIPPEEDLYGKATAVRGEREVNVEDLRSGMVISRDVVDRSGQLIIPRNTIVTDVLKFRLANYFRSKSIVKPIVIESSIKDS